MRFATADYRGHPLPVISGDADWWCSVPEVLERLGLGAAATLQQTIQSLHRHSDDVAELFSTAATEVIPESQLQLLPLRAGSAGTIFRADAIGQAEPTGLAIVIGQGGRDIAVQRAHEHVFGYASIGGTTATPPGDAVDWLELEGRHGSLRMGPWIATAGEIKDSAAFRVRVARGHTPLHVAVQDTIDVSEIVSALSRVRRLEPGDMIVTPAMPRAGALHATAVATVPMWSPSAQRATLTA